MEKVVLAQVDADDAVDLPLEFAVEFPDLKVSTLAKAACN
jgi:hypothetical protein